MKNNLVHLGEFKCEKNPDPLYGFVLERINMLTFVLADGYIVNCKGNVIESVSYTHDGKLIIKTCIFELNLYNMCLNNQIISKIKINGDFYDPWNPVEAHIYEREYKNFRFCNYSNVSQDNNSEIYVLEGVDDE